MKPRIVITVGDPAGIGPEIVAAVMRDASICGLGQTAASAVQSAITTFGLFDGEATA